MGEPCTGREENAVKVCENKYKNTITHIYKGSTRVGQEKYNKLNV